MRLHTRHWGDPGGQPVVCVHGVAQHGVVFASLAARLAARGCAVTAVDLRGHGDSGVDPPWDEEAHVEDLLETVDALGLPDAVWIGHSFGGRLAAAVAARAPARVESLALLEPGFDVPPDKILRAAETERLDWSFATAAGATEAILASPLTLTAPREVVAEYVAGCLRKGTDGRLRFGFSPAATVVAWSEMARPAAPIARCPTLLVRAEQGEVGRAVQARYEDELGELLTAVAVPHGHNVLWEAPQQVAVAVERLIGLGALAEGDRC